MSKASLEGSIWDKTMNDMGRTWWEVVGERPSCAVGSSGTLCQAYVYRFDGIRSYALHPKRIRADEKSLERRRGRIFHRREVEATDHLMNHQPRHRRDTVEIQHTRRHAWV